MKSIYTRFALTVVAVSWIIFALIAAINYHFVKQELLQGATERAKLIAQNSACRIEKLISIAKTDSEQVIFSLKTSDYDVNKIEKILIDTLKKESFFYGMAIAFEPGIKYKKPFCPYYYKQRGGISYLNLAAKNYDYLKKAWFVEARKSLKPSWSEPYFDKGGGETLMTTYSTPIVDNGRFVALLTVDLSLEKLHEIISSIHILKSGYAFLLYRKNRILVHPNSSLIMKKYHRTQFVYNRIIKEGNDWIYYSRIGSTGLILSIVLPDDELFAPLHKMVIYSVVLLLTGTLLLIISIFLVSYRIVQPLKKLTTMTQEIASGDFDKKIELPKSRDEIYYLSSSVNRMQKAIKEYIENLKIATIREQKVKNELEIATAIQMSMLPKPFRSNETVSITALLKPARAVGGDFYDYFNLDEHRLCVVIADVSGKGIPAAIFMATAISYLRAYGRLDIPLSAIMKKLNDTLSRNNDSSMFVTLFISILDTNSGRLEYINAGHTEPYIISPEKGVIKLKSSGNPPIGAFENVKFTEEYIRLERGEKLFLFTDGVSEAYSINDEQFGLRRLISLLEKCGDKSPEECIDTVMDDIAVFADEVEQSDDITMVCIGYE